MRAFLVLFCIAFVIHVVLAGIILGEGFLLHWLFPSLDVGTSMLLSIGSLVATIVFIFQLVRTFVPVSRLLPTEAENEDDEDDEDEEDDEPEPPPGRRLSHRWSGRGTAGGADAVSTTAQGSREMGSGSVAQTGMVQPETSPPRCLSFFPLDNPGMAEGTTVALPPPRRPVRWLSAATMLCLGLGARWRASGSPPGTAAGPPDAAGPRAESAEEKPEQTAGPAEQVEFGMSLKAEGGGVENVTGTVTVPADWPHQQRVREVKRELPPGATMSYKIIEDVGRQMVVKIPLLPAGEEVLRGGHVRGPAAGDTSAGRGSRPAHQP